MEIYFLQAWLLDSFTYHWPNILEYLQASKDESLRLILYYYKQSLLLQYGLVMSVQAVQQVVLYMAKQTFAIIRKILSLEKFCGLAVKCHHFIRIMNKHH